MLKNVPLKSIKHGPLTIEGYSRAAVQSYWAVPELNLGFDLGGHPWDSMGIPTWLITHCHLDHIAALPSYIARRRMMGMTPPRIILPAFAVEPVNNMLRSFAKLDRGRLPCDLVGVEVGQEVELSRELVAQVLKTKHSVPSVGYIVQERRKKLKTEFQGLTGDQIRDLRMAGTEVSHEYRYPIIGYTGDTSPKGLDDNPQFYETKILISEMTYVSPDHQAHLVHKTGHMHLYDWYDRRELFRNEIIIAGHLSARYSAREAERYVLEKFPDLMGGRLKLWF